MQVNVLSAMPLESRISLAVVLLLTLAMLDGLRFALFLFVGVNPFSAVGHIFVVAALLLHVYRARSLGPVLMTARMVTSGVLVAGAIWVVFKWIVPAGIAWGPEVNEPAPIFLFMVLLSVAVGFQILFSNVRPAMPSSSGVAVRMLHFGRWNPYLHYSVGATIVLLQLIGS